MVPDRDRLVRRTTFVLMAIAYTATEVAAYPDGIPTRFGIGWGVLMFVLAGCLSYWVPTPAPGEHRLPARWIGLLSLILVLPILGEPIIRELTSAGLALELQLVNGLRNLGLALCAASAWLICRRLAGVIALFLILFTSAMGDQAAIPYLLGAFAIVGAFWLVVSHQSGLIGVDTTQPLIGSTVERVPMRVPARQLIGFSVVMLGAIAIAFIGPGQVAAKLGEWMPSSGGTGDYDPFARGGVNDGPEETSGANADSVGMIESDNYIESPNDSLYDAVSDMYGQPHKPKKDVDRMIALGPAQVKEQSRAIENRRPSRDFDTSRRGPSSPRKPKSQEGRALIEVEGRTPLHIRVSTYDQYDLASARWLPSPAPHIRPLEHPQAGSEWMSYSPMKEVDWYAPEDHHRLKIADMKGNVVPTPPLLVRFRIHKIDRLDFYEWEHDGVISFAGRKQTPPGTNVQTVCHTIDPQKLPTDAIASSFIAGPRGYLDVPEEWQDRLRSLSNEWAGDLAPGWPRIAAITARLRSDYVFDPNAAPPADHPAPLWWFLTESKRGPDYLFATALTMLLRADGVPARVALGYYAAPEHYDADTAHTPVRKSDVHTWSEILLRDGQWLIAEPTPGYGVLPARLTFREQIIAAFFAIAEWVSIQRWWLLGVLTVGVIVFFNRYRILDSLYTSWWRYRTLGRTSAASQVLMTLRLLERRACWAGLPRSATLTLREWGKRLQSHDPGSMNTLIRHVEWVSYAPAERFAQRDQDAHALCHQAVREWTRQRFAAARENCG